ncbi:sphingomyelin phosphodiesterase 5-like isoform X2 [Palaemon carinicauda]|uniref:sphingomyelin phosphodiesterase 5-like isoform X2 n=1 Tax=Palaemon carinicauda TaxID=392227 RepID=UPI0035B65D2F
MMMTVLRDSRYAHIGWKFLDGVTCILMIPFQHAASIAISSFVFTCHDRNTIIYRVVRYLLVCPLMIFISLLLLPFGIIGYIIWMLINALADVQPFFYVRPMGEVQPQKKKFSNKITVCSANICICPEHIVRFNNQRSVYWRLGEIGKRLLNQDSSLNKQNLVPPVSRENVILTELPDVDVIMLQEVFGRIFGYQMHRLLREKYPYCLYDVGYHKLLGNHGGLGSGLFIASKYPIQKAEFHPFSYANGYGHFVNLGVLIAKLDLGLVVVDGKELNAVGYFADMHAQAYQGKDKIIARQLEEAEILVNRFIEETKLEDELAVCTILGGDFNCDNMSPGDDATQNSTIWDQYEDPCRERAGEDKPWTIGTEHRQPKMNHPFVNDCHEFRKILLDDVQRRHFILDADVLEQTLELMTCSPKPDRNGHVTATKWGGRRRIDHLLSHKESLLSPTGFWFSTAIAGLSDHIPVILMLELTKEHYD